MGHENRLREIERGAEADPNPEIAELEKQIANIKQEMNTLSDVDGDVEQANIPRYNELEAQLQALLHQYETLKSQESQTVDMSMRTDIDGDEQQPRRAA